MYQIKKVSIYHDVGFLILSNYMKKLMQIENATAGRCIGLLSKQSCINRSA